MSQAGFAPHELAALEAVAQWIVDKDLTVPAILLLETMRPLNRVSAAAMTFFHPLIDSLVTSLRYDHLRDALERRESIELLLTRIEALDASRQSQRVEKA